MASRLASKAKIAAILIALAARHIDGVVQWKGVAVEELYRLLGVGSATQRTANDALYQHVRDGKAVKVQDDHDSDFEENHFYFAIVDVAGRPMYVKWILDDDDVDDIWIRIVSFHRPRG